MIDVIGRKKGGGGKPPATGQPIDPYGSPLNPYPQPVYTKSNPWGDKLNGLVDGYPMSDVLAQQIEEEILGQAAPVAAPLPVPPAPTQVGFFARMKATLVEKHWGVPTWGWGAGGVAVLAGLLTLAVRRRR